VSNSEFGFSFDTGSPFPHASFSCRGFALLEFVSPLVPTRAGLRDSDNVSRAWGLLHGRMHAAVVGHSCLVDVSSPIEKGPAVSGRSHVWGAGVSRGAGACGDRRGAILFSPNGDFFPAGLFRGLHY